MIMKRYFLMTWNSQNEFLYNKPIFLTVFMMAIKTGHDIRPSQIFIANYAASLLGSIIGFKVMNAMLFNSEVMGVMPRILEFLLLDELEPVETLNHDLRPKLKDCVVKLDKVTAKWDKNLEQDTLQDISVEVGSDKLLAVIGPVGAGKSSLLMSILRELPVSEGGITVKGRIAYVAQQPWVFSASLRQNIVFGNKFERKKYDRILKACALTKDVTSMPDGDSTLIGDRGVSLSGGQRARVSLARALYMDADIYLLDDPLSAVDASVGRHLFENVVQGLLKSKPRILVTHQLQFLAEADELIILKEGVCLGKGTFVEMANSGIDFSSLLKTDKNDDEEETEMENPKSLLQRLESIPHSPGFRDVGSTFSLTSIGTEFEPEPVIQQPEEERKEGTVGIGIYAEYFKAGAGTFKFLLLVFLNLAAQTAFVMSDWWLAYWSNLEEDRAYKTRLDNSIRAMMESSLNYTSNVTLQTNVTIPYVDTNQYVYIFTGMIAAVFLFGLLRALMFFKVAVDASMNLHNRMFNRMLRSPIAFFDTNPVGRILNRFSKDTGHMDDILPITFFDFIQCFLLILGIIVVVCVVNPWVFIPLVPLCVLFYVVRKYYIQTSRHVKRLEGTTRSPVFSHLSASLQGLHTIRALSVQEKFVTEFDNHQNLHSEAWLMFLVTSRWLAVRLDWICVIFVTVVAMSCVIVRGSIDAGEVGLSLTYAMTLMGMFQWAVRQSTEVENQMISVERILDYSKMDTEGELLSDKGHQPPPDWPQHGKISADKASLKYAENGPRVLKQLTFCIKGEEKIGIVGRTGAGKSSLITMLFRMVEPSGSVKIDDVDIQKIGLHDLRNKISIIPQDPVLFTGSLRKNLDPFGNHDDKHLWSALEEVQMKSAIDDLPSGLESEVSEGGINFSVGQRQLICLARAILRKNKILMIDEATANVDLRTDQLIQETIREKFRQCTVLTIAHRLNTIMDSDKVMMLEEGNILEFDQPYTLLQNEEGHLYKMVQQIGKAEMEHLIEVAKNAFKPSVSSPPSSPVENHIAKNKASSVLPNHTQIICDTEKYPTGDDLDDDVFVHADEDSDPTDKVIGAKQPHEKFSGKKGDVNSSVTTNGAEKDSQAESGVFSPANDLEHFLSDMDSGNSPLLFSARDHIPNENKQGPLNSNSKHKDDSDLNSLMKKGTELTDHVKTGKLPSPSSSFSSEEEENAESSYLIPKDSKENGVTEDNVVNV